MCAETRLEIRDAVHCGGASNDVANNEKKLRNFFEWNGGEDKALAPRNRRFFQGRKG
jgi:hypothetical protein